MGKPKYSYDSKCRELAGHFLSDTVCTDADGEELAQDIQDAVENWFREWESKNAAASRERTITVCDKCRRACCWQGQFMCDDAQTAGTIDLPTSTLEQLGLEHPDYWREAA